VTAKASAALTSLEWPASTAESLNSPIANDSRLSLDPYARTSGQGLMIIIAGRINIFNFRKNVVGGMPSPNLEKVGYLSQQSLNANGSFLRPQLQYKHKSATFVLTGLHFFFSKVPSYW
jgi:hypothetical protein